MGNCQAAEAATVLIQHPGNRVDRIYWSVSAQEVMNSNPGHYIALVVTSPTAVSGNGTPLKQLKLLRPYDTLLIGQVYRLVSFEDVLKEFAAKKCVKLGKLLKQNGGLLLEKKKLSGCQTTNPNPKPNPKSEGSSCIEMGQNVCREGRGSTGRGVGLRHRSNNNVGGGGQWKPALQSISEMGS